MANITTCTKCGGAYEAGSEEQANEPERFCFDCRAPSPGETAPAPSPGVEGLLTAYDDALALTGSMASKRSREARTALLDAVGALEAERDEARESLANLRAATEGWGHMEDAAKLEAALKAVRSSEAEIRSEVARVRGSAETVARVAEEGVLKNWTHEIEGRPCVLCDEYACSCGIEALRGAVETLRAALLASEGAHAAARVMRIGAEKRVAAEAAVSALRAKVEALAKEAEARALDALDCADPIIFEKDWGRDDASSAYRAMCANMQRAMNAVRALRSALVSPDHVGGADPGETPR